MEELMEPRRTEWLKENDLITKDPRVGSVFAVDKVDLEKKGLLIVNVCSPTEAQFLSDADAEVWYKITNTIDGK